MKNPSCTKGVYTKAEDILLKWTFMSSIFIENQQFHILKADMLWASNIQFEDSFNESSMRSISCNPKDNNSH